jgi:hypothetical protein
MLCLSHCFLLSLINPTTSLPIDILPYIFPILKNSEIPYNCTVLERERRDTGNKKQYKICYRKKDGKWREQRSRK